MKDKQSEAVRLRKMGHTIKEVAKIMNLNTGQIFRLLKKAGVTKNRKTAIQSLIWLDKKEKPFRSSNTEAYTLYGQPTTYANRRNNQCRFIAFDDSGCCGADIEKGNYCKKHYDICYTKPTKTTTPKNI